MTYISFEALQRKLESIVTSMCRDIKIDQINLGVADKLSGFKVHITPQTTVLRRLHQTYFSEINLSEEKYEHKSIYLSTSIKA